MADWLHKGSEEIKKANEKSRQQTLGKRSWYKPDRFWMPYSTSKEIVFVDETEAAVHEHAPYIGGTKNGNEFTCPGGPGAPCCRIIGNGFKDRPLMVHFTIIDCDPWTDKQGKTHNFYMKLLSAKYNSHEKLTVKKDEIGLEGKVYLARRYKANMEPKIGSEHSFVRDVEDQEALFAVTHYKGKLLSELWAEAEKDPEKMKALHKVFDLEYESKGKLLRRVPPFNYEEILKPPSYDEIESFLTGYSANSTFESDSKTAYKSNGSSPKSSSSYTAPAPVEQGNDFDEEDVPF